MLAIKELPAVFMGSRKMSDPYFIQFQKGYGRTSDRAWQKGGRLADLAARLNYGLLRRADWRGI